MSPEGFPLLSLAELHQMEMAQLAKERELSDPDPDIWRWSPLEIEEFARMLDIARRIAMDGLRRLTFMEAGSGIGTKLYLAQYHFGMSAVGYEINPEYIKQAIDLKVTTYQCDLAVEDPAWDDGDIVYIARPFKSDKFEVEWENKVMDRMRPGAVLVSAYAAVKPYKWRCYYRAPFRGIWIKPRAGQKNYTDMVHRTTTGSDPLVPEP